MKTILALTLSVIFFPSSASTARAQLDWYPDGDGDGYGRHSATPTLSNTQPTGFVPITGDCDDADAFTHPGAIDVAGDGIDQDCDGTTDNTLNNLNNPPTLNGGGFFLPAFDLTVSPGTLINFQLQSSLPLNVTSIINMSASQLPLGASVTSTSGASATLDFQWTPTALSLTLSTTTALTSVVLAHLP